MPDDLLSLCPPDAKVVDTGPLTLDQIIAKSPRRIRPERTSRDCTPATRRCTVRSPSSAAGSMRSMWTTKSSLACRLSRRQRPRSDAS
jgi:hypothetical protein